MHLTHPEESKVTARRVDPRYARLLVPVIMAIAISLVVSLVQTIIKLGFTPGLVSAWLTSFAIGVVVAIPTAVLVAPYAQRLASRLTEPEAAAGEPAGQTPPGTGGACAAPLAGNRQSPPPSGLSRRSSGLMTHCGGVRRKPRSRSGTWRSCS